MNSADAQHDDRADTALARQTLATHARSFRFAAAFLSKSVADDAAVVYRFCRHVDDLADESECKETAYGALWTVLRQCRGAPGADVTVSRFLSTLARHNVSIDAAECLV